MILKVTLLTDFIDIISYAIDRGKGDDGVGYCVNSKSDVKTVMGLW